MRIGRVGLALVGVLGLAVVGCQPVVVSPAPTSAPPSPSAESSTAPPSARPSSSPVAAARGSWAATGSMVSFRAFDSMVVLGDGSVLAPEGAIATSQSREGVVAGSERFDPATGTWAPTEPMRDPRGGSLLVRLADGRVLSAGGVGDPARDAVTYGVTASAEVFDPATGHWSEAGSMSKPRTLHAGVVLPDGRVLVVGGLITLGNSIETTATADLFDPRTGHWTATKPMSTTRVFHSATLLEDGRVLVVGGGATLGALVPVTSSEIYDPTSGSWSPTGDLAEAPQFHTAHRLGDGRVLLVGVAGKRGIAEIYDPKTGSWTVAAATSSPRTFDTETLLADGRLLVAGGQGATLGAASSAAELFDPVSGTWAAAADMGLGRSSAAAVLLADGRVLVAGGQTDGRTTTGAAEIFTP